MEEYQVHRADGNVQEEGMADLAIPNGGWLQGIPSKIIVKDVQHAWNTGKISEVCNKKDVRGSRANFMKNMASTRRHDLKALCRRVEVWPLAADNSGYKVFYLVIFT